MDKRQARRFDRPTEPRASREDVRLKLIQVAGGDPAFEAKLREMIWHSYCEADRPFGSTEEGMFRWLEEQQLLDS